MCIDKAMIDSTSSQNDIPCVPGVTKVALANPRRLGLILCTNDPGGGSTFGMYPSVSPIKGITNLQGFTLMVSREQYGDLCAHEWYVYNQNTCTVSIFECIANKDLMHYDTELPRQFNK